MRRISVNNTTRRLTPRFPYIKIIETVLPGWDLSLAFVQPEEARAINRTLRKKTYVPNVLSYEVGTKSGEVIICLSEAKRQAPKYGMSADLFVLYLFIHGLLHLKGEAHGVTMERRERELLARFAPRSRRAPTLHGTTHSNRDRHRHLSGETRRRRRNRG